MRGYARTDHPSDDHDLIRQSIKGDLSAFQKLVERHQHYVYSLAFRTLLNKEEAEDMVQETFIKVWLNIRRFDFRGKFTTWIYRIIVNQCLDRLKSKNRLVPCSLVSAENDCSGIGDQDEMKKLEDRDMAGYIKILADHLSPKQRMVFMLRDLQDLSVEEVCQIMQMNEGSVKTNLYLARNTIRLNLIKTGEGQHEMQ